jgi:hypothetical protein
MPLSSKHGSIGVMSVVIKIVLNRLSPFGIAAPSEEGAADWKTNV